MTLRPIRLTGPDLDQFDGWLKSRQINLITHRLYLSAVAAANGGRVPLDPLESDAAADRVGGAPMTPVGAAICILGAALD